MPGLIGVAGRAGFRQQESPPPPLWNRLPPHPRGRYAGVRSGDVGGGGGRVPGLIGVAGVARFRLQESLCAAQRPTGVGRGRSRAGPAVPRNDGIFCYPDIYCDWSAAALPDCDTLKLWRVKKTGSPNRGTAGRQTTPSKGGRAASSFYQRRLIAPKASQRVIPEPADYAERLRGRAFGIFRL
ncbi:hypothetical protein [Kamptonema formosum]|uniref:hypothetical protein n=1 Tax=Kamptonema formosum TaxID=331992 RepID=UPI00036FCE02|nr:hypothetical protein [Oscillatoria sp. PCC 10802]